MTKLADLINYKLSKRFYFKGGRTNVGHITVRHRVVQTKGKILLLIINGLYVI